MTGQSLQQMLLCTASTHLAWDSLAGDNLWYLAHKGIDHDRSTLTRKGAWALVKPLTNGANAYVILQLYTKYNVPISKSEKLTGPVAKTMLDKMQVCNAV